MSTDSFQLISLTLRAEVVFLFCVVFSDSFRLVPFPDIG